MSRTVIKFGVSTLDWVVDMSSMVRGPGGQIDWSKVSDKFLRGATKIKLSAAAAKGASSISVDALTQPLKKGTRIIFGRYTDVTVTVGVAGASAGDTTVPVTALSGPIPNGAVIHLGTNKFLVLNADAAQGATSLTTLAIPTALSSGNSGVFQGGNQEATVDADAAIGATSVTVVDLPFAIADDSEAYYQGDLQNSLPGAKHIPSGTVMAKLSSGLWVPRIDRPGSEEAAALIETDAISDSNTSSLTGYGMTRGANVFENRLPDAIRNGGTLPSGYKTELAANAGQFVYNTSVDSRGQ